jgi:hypothetical protein
MANIQSMLGKNIFVKYLPQELIVMPPVINGGTFSISWNTVSGQMYQVQHTTNLEQAQWQDRGEPVVAFGVSVTIIEPMESAPQRFYRVLRLQ